MMGANAAGLGPMTEPILKRAVARAKRRPPAGRPRPTCASGVRDC
jgi:hypothetical protein